MKAFFFFFFFYLLQWKEPLTMRKGWNVDWWSAPWWINFHQSVAFLSLIIKLNNLFEFFFSLRIQRQELPMRKRAGLETKHFIHLWHFIREIFTKAWRFETNKAINWKQFIPNFLSFRFELIRKGNIQIVQQNR